MKTERLWLEHHAELRRFIHSKLRNVDDTDDLMQEVFVKVHLHLTELKESDRVKQWLYSIARNTVNDHFRKHKPILQQKLKEIADELPVDYSHNRFLKCMTPFIEKLPSKYREAINWTDMHGLSQTQFSEKQKISYSTVKSRVQRARKLLKKYFQDCCEISHDRYGNIINHEPRGNCMCNM